MFATFVATFMTLQRAMLMAVLLPEQPLRISLRIGCAPSVE